MTEDAKQEEVAHFTAMLAASSYRHLIWSATINSIAGASMAVARRSNPQDSLVLLLLALAALIAGVRSGVAAAQVSQHLGWRWPVMFGLLCFIPVIGAVALVAVSRTATTWFTGRGVQVGMLGPVLSPAERFVVRFAKRRTGRPTTG